MSFLESKRLFICAHWQHSASKADRKWYKILCGVLREPHVEETQYLPETDEYMQVRLCLWLFSSFSLSHLEHTTHRMGPRLHWSNFMDLQRDMNTWNSHLVSSC